MKIAIEMKIKKPPPREGSRNTEGDIKSLNMTGNCKKKRVYLILCQGAGGDEVVITQLDKKLLNL